MSLEKKLVFLSIFEKKFLGERAPDLKCCYNKRKAKRFGRGMKLMK